MRFKSICHNNRNSDGRTYSLISFWSGDAESYPINVGQEYIIDKYADDGYVVYYDYENNKELVLGLTHTFENYFYTQEQMRDRKLSEVLS